MLTTADWFNSGGLPSRGAVGLEEDLCRARGSGGGSSTVLAEPVTQVPTAHVSHLEC